MIQIIMLMLSLRKLYERNLFITTARKVNKSPALQYKDKNGIRNPA